MRNVRPLHDRLLHPPERSQRRPLRRRRSGGGVITNSASAPTRRRTGSGHLPASPTSSPDPNDQTTPWPTSAGTGPTVTIPPAEEPRNPDHRVRWRLPVKKGQHLAIDASKSLQATVNDSGEQVQLRVCAAAGGGQRRAGLHELTGELLVAATIEPDADGDGFGDETQDKCPTQATTQGACDEPASRQRASGSSGGKVCFKLSEAATVSSRSRRSPSGRKVGQEMRQADRRRTRRRKLLDVQVDRRRLRRTGGRHEHVLAAERQEAEAGHLPADDDRDRHGRQLRSTTTRLHGRRKKKKKKWR